MIDGAFELNIFNTLNIKREVPKFGGDLFSTIVARIDLLELFHLLVEFELRNLTFCTIRGGGKKLKYMGNWKYKHIICKTRRNNDNYNNNDLRKTSVMKILSVKVETMIKIANKLKIGNKNTLFR